MLWRAFIGLAMWRSRWLRRREPQPPAVAPSDAAADPAPQLPRAGTPQPEGAAPPERRERPLAPADAAPLQTFGRGGPYPPDDDRFDPTERTLAARPWSERTVAALLVATFLAAGCFAGLFADYPNTQLLGLSLGCALLFLATALIVAGKRLVPQETRVEERAKLLHPEEQRWIAQELRSGADGITRRRLLVVAAGAAGTGLTAAAAIPIVGLGPGAASQFETYLWYDGRRLVTVDDRPIAAADVREGSMLAAFPEGTDPREREDLTAPVVLVRIEPRLLRLPAARREWAPEGILAYSKICTHAGCAISLYRSPLHPSTQSRPPALVCPCHYSTFNVAHAAHVEFGPAGRPLPQLPLKIDSEGILRAAGGFSGPVGPSWWGDSQ
jgi:ubiquinol-cytochrome c reductase iron-sulfur subunit